ncbi:histidine kinase/DNA gyrase B/HSP90-like ATPase [Actinocorallia herbida]|uniref:histidine kinase n=1 Tax=Actinocorallia herbida TaxID=58109 RepID=A0A3N1D4X3_9ACTN|nr:ATP-binding protein [Actinocorallia herbida]ROO88601.1 histidine kinase/DNA gyrase B/HSP90-like ATPase [Actinocorallia herbida]
MGLWKRRTAPVPQAAPASGAAPWPPDVAGALALRLLGIVEEQREALDALQQDEDDPKVLEQLYRIDHGNARVRRLVRGLQVLSGSSDGYGGPAATLQDVIAVATGMVGQYQRVRAEETGEPAGLLAAPHFADDLALLLAELLDNGTRYGGAVTTGVYRLEDGSVAVYVRDTGTGCPPDWMARVNAWLAGTVQPVIAENGRHSGLTIVHHLARRHGLQVNVSVAPPAQDAPGTVVTVFVPAGLLRPVPAAGRARPAAPAAPRHAAEPLGAADLPRRVPGAAYDGAASASPEQSSGHAPAGPAPGTGSPYDQSPPFGQGATLADLAAAFSTDPRERPQ